MRKGQILMVALLLVSLLAACAPKAAPAPVPQPPAPAAAPAPAPAPAVAPKAPARPAWQVEWEETMAAAKREGKVMVYFSGGGLYRTELQRNFSQKYGLDMEAVVGRGGELVEKVKAERRAGIYTGDVGLIGPESMFTLFKPAGVLDKLEPMLLLPEVTDPKVWWRGELPWLDTDRMALAGLVYVVGTMVVNSTLVGADELQSYRDLLNPKWKGKIIIDDPTTSGSGSKVIATLGWKIMSWDFVRELAKQEPAITRDQRLLPESVARGKYAIGMGVEPAALQEFVLAGAPLKQVVPKEGSYVTSGTGTISVFNRAPHPAAARVFVNWFLTKEGQTIASQSYGAPSARLDVSTEGIDPTRLIKPGIGYILTNTEEYVTQLPKYRQTAKEIFAIVR